MDSILLEKLSAVTSEEQAILDGRTNIDRDLYMQGQGNQINSRKLLSAGKLITLRPHTRFIHFPEHTHDYVEVVYMCTGSSRHIVNGKTVRLEAGELLFMRQSATHEIEKAGETDVAVNLIVLPEFFTASLQDIGEEETPLRRFLVECLCDGQSDTGYLHFAVSGIKPIQNLIENLLWNLLEDHPNKRKINQMTMTLLFLQLMSHTQMLVKPQEAATVRALSYVESHYVSGSLEEAAALLHYDKCWLSREIKRKTGKNFTQLVQDKRLAQAAFLLKTTDRNVDRIAHAVGYENLGYFHRIFREHFGISPRSYRLQHKKLF